MELARDPAEVEAQVRFLARTLGGMVTDAGASRYGGRLQSGYQQVRFLPVSLATFKSYPGGEADNGSPRLPGKQLGCFSRPSEFDSLALRCRKAGRYTNDCLGLLVHDRPTSILKRRNLWATANDACSAEETSRVDQWTASTSYLAVSGRGRSQFTCVLFPHT